MSAKRRPSIHDLPAAVYRLFDEQDVLLYVGASYDPDARVKRHMTKWWGSEIARTTVTWYTERSAAFRVEADAIRDEEPIYNITSPTLNPGRAYHAPVEMADDEIEDAIVRVVDEFMMGLHCDGPKALNVA